MEQHKDIAMDTAKASVPIAGGVIMQWIHAHDQQVTELTHLFGLISVILGLAWYAYRFWKDIKSDN